MKAMSRNWMVWALLWLGAAVPTPADVMLPDQVIRDTSEQLLGEITSNRAALEQDKGKLYAMVENVVVPHFDVERMSRLVLGKHWKGATPAQREQFVSQFQTLLVRTYATALFGYTGKEKINIRPVQLDDGARQTWVQTGIDLGSGTPVAVNYAFVNTGDAWKVYDVTIDGVSLVTNYRSSYDQAIQTDGIDALIDSLAKKNQELQG